MAGLENVCFNECGEGGGGSGLLVPSSMPAAGFADTGARDTWATAHKDELVKNGTVVHVTGGSWFLWRGDSDPASVDPALWMNADNIIQGPAGAQGAAGAGALVDKGVFDIGHGKSTDLVDGLYYVQGYDGTQEMPDGVTTKVGIMSLNSRYDGGNGKLLTFINEQGIYTRLHLSGGWNDWQFHDPDVPSPANIMLKSTYDSNNTGVVDEADKLAGVDTAGHNEYYGTNHIGEEGFYPIPDISNTFEDVTATADDSTKTITFDFKHGGSSVKTLNVDISSFFGGSPAPPASDHDMWFGFSDTNVITDAIAQAGTELHVHTLNDTSLHYTRIESSQKYLFAWIPDVLGDATGFETSGFTATWTATALTVGGVAGKFYVSTQTTATMDVTYKVVV